MIIQTIKHINKSLKERIKYLFVVLGVMVLGMFISLGIGKIYQHWDNDPDRGAIGFAGDTMDTAYETPVYLEQGWSESDSLWYYNATQGSNLIPYDFYMSLELAESDTLFSAPEVFEKYRYLPQKPTFFNPDGLAVGFTKDSYQGMDYVGYTCAACHTGQVNYRGQAIRIDGGPAMADMVGYLQALQQAMQEVLTQSEKQQRFIDAVLAHENDYHDKDQVLTDLQKWTQVVQHYNAINHSKLDYGYARLDAFGRIYNRVLQHVINRQQARTLMLMATDEDKQKRMLTPAQVDLVMEGISETIIGNQQFATIVDRLMMKDKGYPGLDEKQILRLRDYLFNEPNAPVSYPFLWGITHSDFVQWNGLAGNSVLGPLGRNAGEVIGVFATLDWQTSDDGFNLGAFISGQSNKKQKIDFQSSVDLVNLKRLESHLKSLKSPVWPESILGEIDREKAARGQIIYAEYCQSCHQVVDRDNWDRIIIANMSSLELIGTDPAMARNSVDHRGKTGNFKFTYQGTDVGTVIAGGEAPAAMILTAATQGVVTTPDPDKWLVRRWLDWLYTLGVSIFDNNIKPSIKQGNYKPDTTAAPFNSLLAYKARSLNGIWATAPYLHNGSVPTLYHLLLPARGENDPAEGGEFRPDSFMVGSREFDPIKVGYISSGYQGFEYKTDRLGNFNNGHEYAAGRTPQPNGDILPPLGQKQRWDLLEYLKTL